MGPTNQKKVRRLAIASQDRSNPNDYVSRFVPGEPGRYDFGIDFVERAGAMVEELVAATGTERPRREGAALLASEPQ